MQPIFKEKSNYPDFLHIQIKPDKLISTAYRTVILPAVFNGSEN
jgi:hypothetical protein